MKETVKTSRTAGYLEKIFRSLNAKYFGNELEEPIITIQSTPKAYGHVTVAKAWHKGTTTRHELNIGAGTLDRPIENVVATMLHECVHLLNIQNGVKDCSRGGAYHNKKFREAATARDLDISYDPRIGWSITQPTDALCEFILDQGWEDIKMHRIEWSFTPRGCWQRKCSRRRGRNCTHYNRKQPPPQVCLPLLRQQRPGDKRGPHPVHGLRQANDSGIKRAGGASPRLLKCVLQTINSHLYFEAYIDGQHTDPTALVD